MDNFLPQTYQTVTGYHDMQPHLEDIPLQAPGKNQILIKMIFAPINQTDLINLSGNSRISVNPPYPVGREGSGTIAAVGEDLQVAYKVGDRVHVHSNGTLAQYCLAKSEDCAFIKGDLSFEEAAPFVINPSTAAYIGVVAERDGAKAVINTGASSALGKMLIRLFRKKGIKLINVVRQDKYIDELKKEGADYVLNSESSDFEEKLKKISAKEGATIAFDAINGNFTTDKLLKNMPVGSICYVYGMLSGDHKWKGWDTKKYQFEDEKSVTGLVYTTYIDELKEKGQLDKLWTAIHGSLKTIFRTNVHKIYPLNEIHEAVEYYKANSSKGKILIKLN
jgi:NADPH:quinone reductase-like Zn-dependent oxidoreductase